MKTIVSFVAGVSGASVIGSSHIARGTVNQDTVGWRQSCLWTFLAVADGHGGAPHYRSDRGSRFAVDVLLTLFEDITCRGRLREPAALTALVPTLAEMLVMRWRARVEADIESDPVPEPAGFRSHSVYGSTCLGAAVGPGLSLMLQIGDGGLYVGTAGEDVDLIFPSDDLDGEQTFSLCLPSAIENVKIAAYVGPNRFSVPDFILATTDGLAKSFDSEAAMLDIVHHYRASVRHNGLTKVMAELEPWLSKTSELGSGDDMSVAIFTTAVDHAGSEPIEASTGLHSADVLRPAGINAPGTAAADVRRTIIAAAAAGALVSFPLGFLTSYLVKAPTKIAASPITLPATPPTGVGTNPEPDKPMVPPASTLPPPNAEGRPPPRDPGKAMGPAGPPRVNQTSNPVSATSPPTNTGRDKPAQPD